MYVLVVGVLGVDVLGVGVRTCFVIVMKIVGNLYRGRGEVRFFFVGTRGGCVGFRF